VAAYGEEIAEPDIMTMKKAGCSFGGWYTDETLQERYEFDTMPAENITLYAGWKKKSYLVVWTDYDDTVLKNETVLYGENATAPENPTRTGYQFVGWSSDGSSITANEVIVAVYEKINEPVVSSTPEVSEKPVDSSTPETSEQPIASNIPTVTKEPVIVSSTPATTDEPMIVASGTPATTDKPMVVVSNTPVTAIEPGVTEGAVPNDDTSFATSVPVTDENLSAVTGTSTGANQATPATTKKVTIKIKATYKVPVKNAKPKTVTKKIKSKITLYLDIKQCRTAKFTAIISGKKVTAKWSTSNKKIVSVSAKGKIRAKKVGIAYIRVKAGGQTKKIKVVVKKTTSKGKEKEKMHT
jgi:uncharacterized repeat protein (TIGR02543 family)